MEEDLLLAYISGIGPHSGNDHSAECVVSNTVGGPHGGRRLLSGA